MRRYLQIYILLCIAFSGITSATGAKKISIHHKNANIKGVKAHRAKGTKHFSTPPLRSYGERSALVKSTYYFADFEDTQFPPSGWSVQNLDEDLTWVRSPDASGFGVGDGSVFIDFYDYTSSGDDSDTLFTPVFTNLLAGDSVKFDVAYGLYPGSNDSLIVLLSSDSGATYSRIYTKGGFALKTAVTTDYFIPTPVQWRTERMAMNSISPASKVMLAFVTYNDNGNNLYVDNIRIGKQPSIDIGVSTVHLTPEPYLVNIPLAVQVKLVWGGTSTPPQAVGLSYKLNSIPSGSNDGHFQNFNTFWSGTPPTSTVTFVATYTPPTVGKNTVYVRSFFSTDSTNYNDVGSQTFNVTKVINTFPFLDNFEDSLSSWSIGSFSHTNDWKHGTPGKTLITHAFSGRKCWVTDTVNNYIDNENSYLLSPIFDFSNVSVSPILSFFHNYQIESGYDGGVVEYTTDGTNFSPLGVYDDSNAVHWFDNEDPIDSIASSTWSGSSSDYDDNLDGWVHSSYRLEGFEGTNFVRFRFRFGSDDSENDEGWAIDDVRLTFSSKIAGIVVNDKNANGVRDTNEVGMGNVKVFRYGPRLIDNSDLEIDSTFSDSLGNYMFTNLLPGYVTLQEEIPIGYDQTIPVEDQNGEHLYQLSLVGSDTLSKKDFGNVRLAHISGRKYWDKNANGIFDSSENGIAHWSIVLQSDAAETVQTDSSGYFVFDELTAGTYQISEVQLVGWQQTFPPSGTYSVVLTTGHSRENLLFGNTKSGSLSGMKWNDANGNGVKDTNELGLANWRIIVSGPKKDSTLTDSTGKFSFYLPSGEYTLKEKQVIGWQQTFPGGDGIYHISYPGGIDTTGFNFGNFQLATIAGRMYEDVNQNSIVDSNEFNVLGGMRILLSDGINFRDTVTSLQNGYYTFSGLHSGNYIISLLPAEGWQNTFPQNGVYSVTLGSGEHISGKNFALFGYGAISGTVFHDRNADGIRNDIDSALAIWKIYLSVLPCLDSSGCIIDSSLSDAQGNYKFSQLNYGKYMVREAQRNAWYLSITDSGYYLISVQSRTNEQNKSFGNYKTGSFGGYNFLDVNGNGIKDTSDSALTNWKMKVSGLRSDSILTNSSGIYGFTALHPGIYTISEEHPSGWIQTFPAGDGTYIVTLLSGDVLSNKHFGNARPASISGYTFTDNNGDGVRQSGDGGLGQWIIRLGGANTRTAITAENGRYEFTNLIPGIYTVREEQQDGWHQTLPHNPEFYSISLLSNIVDSQRNFGNYYDGAIFGYSFNDLNGNGTHDVDEPALPNWKIRISGAKTDSAFTDENGNYAFNSLLAGHYIVAEEHQSGWEQTFPTGTGTHSVTMTSGLESENNFGNHLVTGVIEEHSGIPKDFALYQNFPNPFNPTTNIRFDLPQQSTVILKVFDILGQEVVLLTERHFLAGKYSLNFDASTLNSGIYFFRITAQNENGTHFTSMKKMILLK